MQSRVPTWCALATAVAAAGCADSSLDFSTSIGEAVVADFEETSCSTEVVLALSIQIADEVACLEPDALVRFGESEGIVFTGSAVLPYLAAAAAADLAAAAADSGGTIEVNRAYRTVAQQYLLRRWFELGRCGIAAAALPGSSNHESGRALDIGNWEEWVTILPGYGWDHDVPGDDVHFDHLMSPDIRGTDILAFQRLWNRNHPEDPIAEDASYGPETEARLAIAPAGGFATGTCNTQELAGDLVAVTGPATLAPGATAELRVEVANTGTATWRAATTQIATSDPPDRASLLVDDTWTTPTRPAHVDADTAPGETGLFVFTIAAPADEATIAESFALVDGEVWFTPGITVELDVIEGGGDDDGKADDGGDGLIGGCAAGGGGADAAAPLLIALITSIATIARRRRRRGVMLAP